MSYLGSPFHSHDLSLRNLSKHYLQNWNERFDQVDLRCDLCLQGIDGSTSIYCCEECQFYIHTSCDRPPSTIEHYLHPVHALAFTRFPHEKEHKCPSCSLPVNDDSYFYACHDCDFYIHRSCALQTLAYLDEGLSMTVRHSLHDHELKLCNFGRHNCKHCTVCDRTIRTETPAYRCISQECSFQVHTSCAQLPSNLEHPSHSPHQLTLSNNPPDEDLVCCRCCRGISGLFSFSCRECNVNLHVDCARTPSLIHPFHEHNLFYFGKLDVKLDNYGNAMGDSECSACRRSCNVDLFRCALCDFNLHYHCSKLLPTITSKFHNDPLVLCESIIEDDYGNRIKGKTDDYGKYYCDFCEKRRDPKKWVYFCESGDCKCKFVGHIECALSQERLDLIEEDTFITREEVITGREEDIKLAQKQVDATEAALMPQMEKLESLRAGLESTRVKLEELKAEHAEWMPLFNAM